MPDTVIPDKVDLREFLWPVEDVGDILAAAASAAAVALEFHCNRMGEEPTDLSSMFIHYNARRLKGDVQANRGTSLADALKAIATYGACREATWPFDPKSFATEPPPQAYAEARKFTAIQFYPVDDLFQALALRYPAPFLVRIPRRCLDEATSTGLVPPPTTEERAKADAQPACGMVLVGYDKTERTFIARNCWGRQWGDDGYCRIPFDAMSVFAPTGAERFWVIGSPEVKDVTRPLGSSDYGSMAAGPGAAPPQPGGLASSAARMRDEIRNRLDRDFAASSKRIDDLLSRKTGAPQPPAAKNVCSSCSGSGSCWYCRGSGCSSCGKTGSCPSCNGRGSV